MATFRLMRTNIYLRVLGSIGLVAALDFIVLLTGMPVVTCFMAIYRDGATQWLLVPAQALLAFCIYAASFPVVGLRDLWRGEGIFCQELPRH